MKSFFKDLIIKYSDRTAPLGGPLGVNGYMVIPNYFSGEDLKKFPDVTDSLSTSDESLDILLKFPFLGKILLDETIISIIYDYLGGNAVFDYASGRSFISSGPKSDVWHHDSVGHRIKIFLCLSDQDSTSHTQVVPNSQIIRYRNYTDSRLNQKEIEDNERIIEVIGKQNDLIIFDTNLIHKGVYSDLPRNIVQFEFSNIVKSLLRGHIGPRKVLFSRDLLSSKLISKGHVKLFNGNYCYK